jgi:drug/metabolite transporter (DMT)-like permease
MIGILLALGSGMAWGAADFLGGLKTRTVSLAAVSVYSQAVALVILLVLLVLAGMPSVDASVLLWGLPTGVAYVVGLGAFYQGLATGRMSLVAPIVGMHAALPIAAGLLAGEQLGTLQTVGMAVALIGILFTARGDAQAPEYRSTARVAAILGVVAAIGLGANLVGIDAAIDGQPESALLWLLVATRVVAIVVWTAIGLVCRQDLRRAPAQAIGALVGLGVLDVTANLLYGLAVRESLLSLAAVLVSLHPISTVILSRIVLGERLDRSRKAGIGLAVTGVMLLST